jgi:phage replication-related protein YjqB (UPF0714/DUF867 family)
MADKYQDFSAMSILEKPRRDYLVRLRNRRSSIVIVAPHGGGIEPGTSEIAEAIAGGNHSFYAFEGIKSRNNRNLHITSARFDEPRCLALVESSTTAITVHGEGSEGSFVFLGGRDKNTLKRIASSLLTRRFRVKRHKSPMLQGQDSKNICNRVRSGIGVQIELSKGLRRSFFRSFSRDGRACKTLRFHDFVDAVREGIE